MQNKIHNTLAGGIAGQIHDELPINPITRIAADENCIAGKFVFEGDDGETKAVGIKPEAVQDEILGVVKRAPFITGVGNSQKYPINSSLTIVNSGNVDVDLPMEEVKLNDKVYVDNSTGLITTKLEIPSATQALKEDRYISLEFNKLSVKPSPAFLALETDGKMVIATSYLDYPVYSTDGVTFFQNKTPIPFLNIAYGDNKFVGVGATGVAYSTDGINFSLSSISEGAWTNIIYGNGKFVALGFKDVAYSTDGITFTDAPKIDVELYNSFTFGNGLFVVLGYTKLNDIVTSKIMWSNDGINFTDGTIDNAEWSSVIFGNNIFVAVAVDGSTAYSIDGINFVMGQKLEVGLYCIGFTGEVFVAAASDGSKIAYSTDGKNFDTSSIKIPQSYGEIIINSICFANNKIYLTGYSVNQATNEKQGIICTIDNFQENFKFVPGENYATPLSSITYGKNKFVTVGNNSTAYSTDGVNFTAGTIPAGNWSSIIYDDEDDMFISVSTDGKCAHSTDGVNFTAGTIPTGNWKCITAGNDEYIVVGDNRMSYSSDGVNFTAGTIPTGNWSAAVHGEFSYIVVSSDGKAIYTTERLNFGTGSIPNGNWSSIAYGKRIFVAVSLDGKTAYSENGTTFTLGSIPNAQWTNITYADGLFIAVSSDGKAAYSRDGINFTIGVIPNEEWNSIIYGDDKFVVTSAQGNIVYSVPIDINPTFCEVIFSDFSGGIYNNNDFVAISSNGPIFHRLSENMLVSNVLSNGNWNGIAYGNGLYIAVGDNGSVAYSEEGIVFGGDSNGKIPNARWLDIVYGNGKFVAISYAKTAYRTDDAKDFLEGVIPGSSTFWNSITFGNGVFVTVSYTGKIAYSDDGISFQYGTIPPSSWCSVVFGNGTFVAVADNGNTAYSTDGKTFYDGSGPNGFWTSVAFLDKTSGLVEEPLFIMTSTNGKIAYSTDGIAFLEYKGVIPETKWNVITFMAKPNLMALMNEKNIYAVKVTDSDEPIPPTPSNFLDTGFKVLRRIDENLVTICK